MSRGLLHELFSCYPKPRRCVTVGSIPRRASVPWSMARDESPTRRSTVLDEPHGAPPEVLSEAAGRNGASIPPIGGIDSRRKSRGGPSIKRDGSPQGGRRGFGRRQAGSVFGRQRVERGITSGDQSLDHRQQRQECETDCPKRAVYGDGGLVTSEMTRLSQDWKESRAEGFGEEGVRAGELERFGRPAACLDAVGDRSTRSGREPILADAPEIRRTFRLK